MKDEKIKQQVKQQEQECFEQNLIDLTMRGLFSCDMTKFCYDIYMHNKKILKEEFANHPNTTFLTYHANLYLGDACSILKTLTVNSKEEISFQKYFNKFNKGKVLDNFKEEIKNIMTNNTIRDKYFAHKELKYNNFATICSTNMYNEDRLNECRESLGKILKISVKYLNLVNGYDFENHKEAFVSILEGLRI